MRSLGIRSPNSTDPWGLPSEAERPAATRHSLARWRHGPGSDREFSPWFSLAEAERNGLQLPYGYLAELQRLRGEV